MRIALLAAALALTLAASGLARADSSILTYHGALDRSGRYVVPGLTYERARGLHLDASFHAPIGETSMPSRLSGKGPEQMAPC